MGRHDSEEMVSVPCPECGPGSEESVQRVAAIDVSPCSQCGGLIDLSAKERQAAVAQAKARVAHARKM